MQRLAVLYLLLISPMSWAEEETDDKMGCTNLGEYPFNYMEIVDGYIKDNFYDTLRFKGGGYGIRHRSI